MPSLPFLPEAKRPSWAFCRPIGPRSVGRLAEGTGPASVVCAFLVASMAAMATTIAFLVSRGTAAARRSGLRLLLVAATLLGLVVMHQLAGATQLGHRSHGEGHSIVAQAPHDCPSVGDHCPASPHGHSGQVCQPAPPNSPAAAPPVMLGLPVAAPAGPPLLSARTAAVDAAGGSGCGPPSLTQLSLLRI